MTKKYIHLLLAIATGLLLSASCNQIGVFSTSQNEEQKDSSAWKVKDYYFSPDYKNLTVRALQKTKIPETVLINRGVTVSVNAPDVVGQTNRRSMPVLKEVQMSGYKDVDNSGIRMRLLVDLTLRQEDVDNQKLAVMEIREIFRGEHLLLYFLDGKNLSQAYDATDYILDHYFVSTRASSKNDKYLYDAILKLTDNSSPRDSSLVYMVFSDGYTYNFGKPVDPEHFAHQEALRIRCRDFGLSSMLSYVNFGDEGNAQDSRDFLTSLCKLSGGLYQKEYDWYELKNNIFSRYKVDYADYSFLLEYPDNTVFNGKRTLNLECRKDTTVLANAALSFRLGTFYCPVIVNGRSVRQIVVIGTLFAIIFAIMAYVIFQLIAPKIGMQLFERKYIRRYERENMTVGGMVVDKECYYCKAPFNVGDQIVVKCKHVMHLHCWNENGYHCPEHGRHCKEGSHYYNMHDPFDPQNASYLMKWVLIAIVAGYVSWLCFSVVNHSVLENALLHTVTAIFEDGMPRGTTATNDMVYSNMNQVSSVGMWMGLALTFAISLFSVHRRETKRFILDVLVRTIAGACCGLFFFSISSVSSAAFDLGNNSFLIDWIPWSLTSVSIIFISTLHTRIKPRRDWIIASIILGVASMILWQVVFVGYGKDYRVMLLSVNILFTIGLVLSIAEEQFRSERYFLHVSGSIKEMDLALYKWFSANSNATVSVGRSVDCDIVMSWDVMGDIAPVHAILSLNRSHVFVTALEKGVYVNGEALSLDKATRLYHGNVLKIGTTSFTYVEKDMV